MPHGVPRSETTSALTTVTAGGTATPFGVRTAEPALAETKEQAVERAKASLQEYLLGISERLPQGVPCRVVTMLDDDARSALVRFAMTEQPDMIVMATHGHTGLVHVLFGDVAESVVRSGVAPVLLVQPDEIRRRQSNEQG
jgi:nucleotide-binding universal stress UspA family protein